MIKKFEYLVFSYNQPSFYNALQEFNKVWLEFSGKFKLWKKKDSEALLALLIQHWIEMENLWFSVKDYEAANTWQTKIVIQQRSIKKKIETLAGRSGILKLIRLLHKSREPKFPNVKFKPNVMPSPYLFPIDENNHTTINPNSVIGPIPKEFIASKEISKNTTVRTESDSETTKAKDNPQNINPKNETKTIPSKEQGEQKGETKKEGGDQQKKDETRDIDQTFVMNLLNEYNHCFSNVQLAHEIILNPNFQFEYLNDDGEEEETTTKQEKNHPDHKSSGNNYNNIISKVTKIAQKAFFDMVQESFDSGKESQFIPGIVKDIKDVRYILFLFILYFKNFKMLITILIYIHFYIYIIN